MASLHFIFSAMNAGKTTTLLQAAFNYRERGMRSLLLKSNLDTRDGKGLIQSRIGLSSPCRLFDSSTDLFSLITDENAKDKIHCVLVDEAQFMDPRQVDELSDVVDKLGIPVMCYGLRSDFQGNVFPGSCRLLTIAEKLREHVVVCGCGRKATHVVRLDSNGKAVTDGAQVVIGGNDTYVSKCRSCFKREVGGLR